MGSEEVAGKDVREAGLEDVLDEVSVARAWPPVLVGTGAPVVYARTYWISK